jgi:hypothetical protein
VGALLAPDLLLLILFVIGYNCALPTAVCEQLQAPNSPALLDEHSNKNTGDVDFVVLWCDGSDQVFAQNRVYWEEQIEQKAGRKLDENGTSPCRFRNNDELKYVFRSIETYAPWIRLVFLVVDNQLPSWLNTAHPKLRIVNHTDFIPEEYLPTFNSRVIESFLPNITELGEKFLYANDDMVLGNYVSEDFFFDDGRPIVRLSHQFLKGRNLYSKTVARMYDLIAEKYPCAKITQRYPHHNIDSYLKSAFTKCIQRFQKEYDTCRKNKFRVFNDMQRIIVGLDGIANGTAVWKRTTLLESVCVNVGKSSRNIKNKPKMFCINDTEGASIEDKQKAVELFEEYFPHKSSFEL